MQCQAKVYNSSGFGHYYPCDKDAKHEVTTRDGTVVSVCGVHRNVLNRGGHFGLTNGGWVHGIKDDATQRKERIETLQRNISWKKNELSYAKQAIGSAVLGGNGFQAEVDKAMDIQKEINELTLELEEL